MNIIIIFNELILLLILNGNVIPLILIANQTERKIKSFAERKSSPTEYNNIISMCLSISISMIIFIFVYIVHGMNMISYIYFTQLNVNAVKIANIFRVILVIIIVSFYRLQAKWYLDMKKILVF